MENKKRIRTSYSVRREALTLLLPPENRKTKDIAEQFGVNVKTIYNWVDQFQEENSDSEKETLTHKERLKVLLDISNLKKKQTQIYCALHNISLEEIDDWRKNYHTY